MKSYKPKMSLAQKTFYIISFIVLIGAFIYLGNKSYEKKSVMSDSEKFTLEFGIPQNNVFKYKKNSEILETLNTGSALIFMAYPENNWSSYYSSLLNEIALSQNINEIYFYNFYNDRRTNNYYYENIVDYLTSYTTILDDETSVRNGDYTIKDYWTNEKKRLKAEELRNAINLYKGNLS